MVAFALAVNGHRFLPQLWPSFLPPAAIFLPSGGHQFSPVMRSARSRPASRVVEGSSRREIPTRLSPRRGLVPHPADRTTRNVGALIFDDGSSDHIDAAASSSASEKATSGSGRTGARAVNGVYSERWRPGRRAARAGWPSDTSARARIPTGGGGLEPPLPEPESGVLPNYTSPHLGVPAAGLTVEYRCRDSSKSVVLSGRHANIRSL